MLCQQQVVIIWEDEKHLGTTLGSLALQSSSHVLHFIELMGQSWDESKVVLGLLQVSIAKDDNEYEFNYSFHPALRQQLHKRRVSVVI